MSYDVISDIEGLPTSIHGEVAILGAMMLDAVAIADATAMLSAEDFSLDSHRKIYRAMLDAMERGFTVDQVTLSASLRRSGALTEIGGPAYLAYLTEGIPRNLNVENYVRIVRDKSLAREGMAIMSAGVKRFVDGSDDALVVFNDVQAKLERASAGIAVEETLESQSEREFETLERQRLGDVTTFVPSGLSDYDQMHGGFAVGEMTVLGARPRIGKSTLIRQALAANCEVDNFVHLFTPEMREGQVLRGLWGMEARVPFNKLRRPERLTGKELDLLRLAKGAIADWPMKIDGTSPITSTELISRARRVKRMKKTKLLEVDYLQKLAYRGRSQDRHIEVTDSMVALTSFSKNEDIALLVASSITDPSGKEKNRVPTLDDLRQSGDIKFEANTVLLLHRDFDGETQKLQPETKLIVGKSRADTDGLKTIYFDGSMQRFMDRETYMRGIGR